MSPIRNTITLLLATILAGCGGGGASDAGPTSPIAPASVASVSLSPSSVSIAVGGSQQLTATVKDASGNVLTGRTVSYSSSDAAKAAVSTSGLVTGISVGSTTVTASSEGQSASVSVVVAPAPTAIISKVSLDPASTINVGSLYNGVGGVVAKITDIAGKPLANAPVTFTVTAGNGLVDPWRSVVENAVITDVSGIAKATFATGSVAGMNTVTATTPGALGAATFSVVTINPGPYTFQDVVQVLGPADVGVPVRTNGFGPADVSAFELPDGRVRLFYGIAYSDPSKPLTGSAISSDGVHFTVEPGYRTAANTTQIGNPSALVYPLPGGGYRWFYEGGQGLRSATSADGLNFTEDPGNRFASPNNTGARCGGIVKLADGRYRMYCSVVVSTTVHFGAPIFVSSIFTAISTDLFTWSTEPGYLVGPGSAAIPGDGAHPTPIVNADGSISIVYYRFTDFPILENSSRYIPVQPMQEWIATASDGRSFTTEVNTGVAGTEPSYLKRRDGTVFFYHGGVNDPGSSTILVSSVTRNSP